MQTQVINVQHNSTAGTQLAAKLIKEGELVAFPTETVYGLGANGLNGEAVQKIFAAKGRPNDNPLILHVSRKSDTKKLWTQVTPMAQRLMDTFWPGPLTLIYERSNNIPDEVTAGLDTVAVRMPYNDTARALIRESGVPIAAPSANSSGRPSPTTAQHVLEDLNGKIPLILDGGMCRYGVESTVLSIIGKPKILRPGAITRHMLESVIGEIAIADSILNPLKEGDSAPSPGMKYQHYAPDADVIVVEGTPYDAANCICKMYASYEAAGKKCAILATKQTERFYQGRLYQVLGDRKAPQSMCATLFALLREMETKADIIFAEGLDAEEVGLAFMNRLLRAAGFRVVKA